VHRQASPRVPRDGCLDGPHLRGFGTIFALFMLALSALPAEADPVS
jgi:hypothetical protein